MISWFNVHMHIGRFFLCNFICQIAKKKIASQPAVNQTSSGNTGSWERIWVLVNKIFWGPIVIQKLDVFLEILFMET